MFLNTENFVAEESGAVTVDWVVLTAALVGLGLAVMGVVSTGVQDVSGDMQTQLEADNIIMSSFDNGSARDALSGGFMSGVDGASNADLGAQYASILPDVPAAEANVVAIETHDYASGALTLGGTDYASRDDAAADFGADYEITQQAAYIQNQAQQRGVTFNPTSGEYE